MKMTELMADGYKVWGRLKDESRDRNIQSLQYIDTLANSTSVDISEWNILDIFGSRGKSLIVDRTEINKRFFRQYEHLKAQRPPEENSIEQQAQDRINELAARSVARQLEQIANSKRQLIRRAKARYREFEEYLSEAHQLHIQELGLQREGNNYISAQISTVLTEGFWTNPVMLDDYLYLTTSTNIVNTERNESAGIDRRVEFGKFAAKVDIANMRVWLLPFENNVHVNGYYSPYVSCDGNICWGNAADAATRALSSGNLLQVLRMLANLVSNYSTNTTPHMALERFASDQCQPVDPNDRTNRPRALQIEEDQQRERQRRQQEQQAS